MHRLALILVLTSACVAGAGDEGFGITHNLAPGDNCSIAPGGAFLARGLIDKQSPSPYLLTPEIVSFITTTDGTAAQRTIALRGAKVEVFDATGTSRVSKGKFTSLFSASLEPGGKTSVAFDIIRPDMLAAAPASGTMRAQYVAKITPFGVVGGGGDTVDGVPFEYPVTICDSCVARILGACPLPFGTAIAPSDQNACNTFQDGSVSCCMSATGPVCPATIDMQQFALTVTKAGAAAATATVSSTPAGINCGATCTASYVTGTSVTLTATGATTVMWTGISGCTTGPTCVVTMDAARSVTVTLQ
ncbi:MAG: hypothetical protein M4D80_35005 [Myxococcota bacterium]|nr:hypothetical protein [Myxococcota bacterium]